MNNEIQWVHPDKIKLNEFTEFYGTDDQNIDSLRLDIEKNGILEPLIVDNKYVVLSGNRRLYVAKELRLSEIPVIVADKENNLISFISHNNHRIKTPSQKIKEINIINDHYGLNQGSRTDLDSTKREGKELRDNISRNRTEYSRLMEVNKLLNESYEEDSTEHKQFLRDLDSEKHTLSGGIKTLKTRKADRNNKEILKNSPIIPNTNDFTIHNLDSRNLEMIDDKSIQCIVTSPPYYQYSDYQIGENHLGRERISEEFINNLAEHFAECYRVLKEEGSLWVNISDTIRDGNLLNIPHLFVNKMKKKGWIINDEVIFNRSNPRPHDYNRSIKSHEYIFHFVKTRSFYYIPWGEIDEESKENINFSGSILQTGLPNYRRIHSFCEQEGITVDHTSAFPLEVPRYCILSSSRPGDIILDIFSGLGSTGIASLMHKRQFVGFELNPLYERASKIWYEAEMKERYNLEAA